ncbi:Pectinacetylesterase family protein [Perilla frutescens var. hirtella]|nr:Pectinacetylesterase family protein [Perilla frutescens var. hirtella]
MKWWLLSVLSCLFFLINTQVNSQENAFVINITFITDAVAKGAVCLDGSPGAYYFAQGFGNGVNSWVVNLQGGGWCSSKVDCLDRSARISGSTQIKKDVISTKFFGQMLSPNHDENPDFYNWNRVFVRYCDGASFMADVEAVDPDSKLHLRGRRIFNTIMEELISEGMANATDAILIGESAGGLATILNCDGFHSFLPNTKVKCISDSGFFINA